MLGLSFTAFDPERTKVVTSVDTASARLWEIAERYSSGMPALRKPSISRSEYANHFGLSDKCSMLGLELSDGEVNERSHITKLVRIPS